MKTQAQLAWVGLLAAVLILSGCSNEQGGTITKSQEEMMRRPPGQNPMPAEAAQAMQRAQEEAARKSQGGK